MVSAMAIIIFVLFYPWIIVSVSYRRCDVNNSEDTFSTSAPLESGLVIYKNGCLYLKTQTVYSALILVTGVERVEWSLSFIKQVLADHEELKGELKLEGDHWYLRNE